MMINTMKMNNNTYQNQMEIDNYQIDHIINPKVGLVNKDIKMIIQLVNFLNLVMWKSMIKNKDL